MNKMLLSTVKVIALFSAATFFAYMILKAQIKKNSDKPNSFSSSKSAEMKMEEQDIEDVTNPVLTTVSSTKAETVDIDFSDEGLDLVLDNEKENKVLTTVRLPGFHSSKSAALAMTEEEEREELNAQKKYLKLEEDTLDENGKEKKKEFFHSSKAPLTTVLVENIKEEEVSNEGKSKVLTFIPSSKAAPIDFIPEPKTNLKQLKEKRIAEEEQRLLKLIENLEAKLKLLKSELSKLRNTK